MPERTQTLIRDGCDERELRRCGMLVRETTHRRPDPDAIAWMVCEGPAHYREDNTGPTRLVQDVVPVTGKTVRDLGYGIPVQRWENAEFQELNSADAYAAFRREGCGRIKAWRLARRARKTPEWVDATMCEAASNA